jgi:hypothetical protein
MMWNEWDVHSGRARWLVSEFLNDEGRFGLTWGSSIMVIMGTEEGMGVVVRVRGGREDRGMAFVIMESDGRLGWRVNAWFLYRKSSSKDFT